MKKSWCKRGYRRSRHFTALLLITGILSLLVPKAQAQGGYTPVSPSQVKTEAGWYNTAIREISSISTMKLSTSDELAKANAIIKKQISNLRYHRSKLVALGLDDSSFIAAVKARTGDSKSAELFLSELAKDANSIFNISGAQALADSVRRSHETDVAKIRQVAAQLKAAASDVKDKTKQHHTKPIAKNSSAIVETSSIAPLVPELTSLQTVAIVLTVAVIAVPPLALALYVATTTAVGVAIWAWFVFSPMSVLKSFSKGGQDRIEACQDEVDVKYKRCLDAAIDEGILRIPAEAICYAEWLLGRAACLILP